MSLFIKVSEVECSDDPFLVEDFIHEEVTVMYGRPEAGKSFLALSLAYAMSTGGTWMNREVPQTKVALWALDPGGKKEAKRRYQNVGTYSPAQGHELLVMTAKPDWRSGYREAWWDGFIAQLVGAKIRVIIIDNLTRLLPAGSSSRFDNDVSYVTEKLDLLAAEGISILLLHHKGKYSEDNRDAKRAPMGATSIEAWARHLVDVELIDKVLLVVRTDGNDCREKYHFLAFMPNFETKDGLFMEHLYSEGEDGMQSDSYEEILQKAQESLEKQLKIRHLAPADVTSNRQGKQKYSRTKLACADIIKGLAAQPKGLATMDVYALTEASNRIAAEGLKALVESGQVKSQKQGKSVIYSLALAG